MMALKIEKRQGSYMRIKLLTTPGVIPTQLPVNYQLGFSFRASLKERGLSSAQS